MLPHNHGVEQHRDRLRGREDGRRRLYLDLAVFRRPRAEFLEHRHKHLDLRLADLGLHLVIAGKVVDPAAYNLHLLFEVADDRNRNEVETALERRGHLVHPAIPRVCRCDDIESALRAYDFV